MDENSILKKAAEVFTDKPTTIEITPEPKNRFHKLMMFLGLKKKGIKYQLRPVLVGNRARIASRAVRFPKDVFKNGYQEGLFNLSVTHNEDMIYIAAVGLQNDRDEPSLFLLEELKWIQDKVLAQIVDQCLSQIDLDSFMKSTILIAGTEILKMGPKEQKEIIASGE